MALIYSALRSLCFFMGSYSSFKALSQGNLPQIYRWTVFWICLSLVKFIEPFSDIFIGWLPFYNESKMVLMLGLMIGKTGLSGWFWGKILWPLLEIHRVDQKVDKTLSTIRILVLLTIKSISDKSYTFLKNLLDRYNISQTLDTRAHILMQESRLLLEDDTSGEIHDVEEGVVDDDTTSSQRYHISSPGLRKRHSLANSDDHVDEYDDLDENVDVIGKRDSLYPIRLGPKKSDSAVLVDSEEELHQLQQQVTSQSTQNPQSPTQILPLHSSMKHRAKRKSISILGRRRTKSHPKSTRMWGVGESQQKVLVDSVNLTQAPKVVSSSTSADDYDTMKPWFDLEEDEHDLFLDPPMQSGIESDLGRELSSEWNE